jgi:hypothetical protein
MAVESGRDRGGSRVAVGMRLSPEGRGATTGALVGSVHRAGEDVVGSRQNAAELFRGTERGSRPVARERHGSDARIV